MLKQIKRNGSIKLRTVYDPSRQYKALLRKINKLLLQPVTLPEGVLGGLIGKSIYDMAKVHCHQEAVLSIDLKDFFPSIKSGRVVGFFRSAGCSPEVAGLLTDLVTLNGCVPQGFPTSPMLANMIAYGLDVQHIEIAKRANLQRTRWIDDIVFSGRIEDLESRCVSLLGAIRPHGFRLNYKKTKYVVRSSGPTVTGLEVRRRSPRVSIAVIDTIRDRLLECQHSGIEVVQMAFENETQGRRKDLSASLYGRINYVRRYNRKEGDELLELYHSVFSKP